MQSVKFKFLRFCVFVLFLLSNLLLLSKANITYSNDNFSNGIKTLNANVNGATFSPETSQTTSFLARYKLDSEWVTSKFSYDVSTGKWLLKWSNYHMWPGGVEDTDNDGVLEDYTYHFVDVSDGCEYHFYRIDDDTGEIIWSKLITLDTHDYYRWFQFEDFNNDGIKEIVIGKQFDDTTSPVPLQLLILNSTNGDTLLWYDGGSPQLWSYPILYDYNEDGIRDILFYGWPDNSKTYFRVVSFKDFQPTILASFDISCWGLSKSYIADFDSDGQPEWLIGGWGSSYWSMYDNDYTELWSVPLEGNADGNSLITNELLSEGFIAIGTASYYGTSEYIHLVYVNDGSDVFPKINICGNSFFPENAVFDLNHDGYYEILTMVIQSNNAQHMALIDTKDGTKLWELDNYNLALLPPQFLSNSPIKYHAFVDFDNDGTKDIININRANGDVIRFHYDGHTETLGNIINDNNLDISIATLDFAMFYKTSTNGHHSNNNDLAYIDENNQLWINTNYYQWRVTNDSSLILKTGTEPRNVSIYPRVFLNCIDTKNPGSYRSHEYTAMNILYNDGNKSIIYLERKMIYYDHTVYLRMNFTVEKSSGLIKIDSYIYNPDNYQDVYTLTTQMQMITGGDETNDYYYYSGASSAHSFPYSNWDEILPSEVTPYNEMMYITMYDASCRQGVAMFANYSIHGDHWTDIHYGSVMEAHGIVYAQYNKIGLFLTPNQPITYYILFYTTDANISWKPVEDSIDAVIEGSELNQDITPPSISQINYSPVTPTAQDQLTISCIVTDDSGVQLVSLYYRVNSGSWHNVSMAVSSSPYYVATIGPFAAGSTIDFYIHALDTYINSINSDIITFSVCSNNNPDTTPPSITDIKYLPSNPTSNDVISISCIVTDDSGIQLVSLYYRVNSGSWDKLLMGTRDGSTYIISIGPFESGSIIKFYIRATDKSGNSKDSNVLIFSITSGENRNTNVKSITIIPFESVYFLMSLVAISLLAHLNKNALRKE